MYLIAMIWIPWEDTDAMLVSKALSTIIPHNTEYMTEIIFCSEY